MAYLRSRQEIPNGGWTVEMFGLIFTGGSFKDLSHKVYKASDGSKTLSQISDDIEIEMCKKIPPASCTEVRGLGDVVAFLAQPLAGALDSVLGTNIKKCGGCQQRRDSLNRNFPLAGGG